MNTAPRDCAAAVSERHYWAEVERCQTILQQPSLTASEQTPDGLCVWTLEELRAAGAQADLKAEAMQRMFRCGQRAQASGSRWVHHTARTRHLPAHLVASLETVRQRTCASRNALTASARDRLRRPPALPLLEQHQPLSRRCNAPNPVSGICAFTDPGPT